MTIANRLRAFLDRDGQEESIVASRGGLINRAHYARLLGVSVSLLCGYYKDILSEYEEHYQIATGPLAKLEEMRAWLEQAFNSGELKIRDGRVDRLACMAHCEVRGSNAITTFPEVRELFDSFDRRVEAEGYLPNVRRVELDKVKAWLCRPVLNKDRLTINRQVLTAAVEIEVTRLKDREFAGAIEACEAKVLEKSLESRIDPCFHGRVFPFSELEIAWSRDFLERVGARYKTAFSGSAATSAKAPYLVLFGALKWIGQSNNPICRAVVADAKANGKLRGAPFPSGADAQCPRQAE